MFFDFLTYSTGGQFVSDFFFFLVPGTITWYAWSECAFGYRHAVPFSVLTQLAKLIDYFMFLRYVINNFSCGTLKYVVLYCIVCFNFKH